MKTSALRIPKPKLPVARDQDWQQEEMFESDPRPEMLCFRGRHRFCFNRSRRYTVTPMGWSP